MESKPIVSWKHPSDNSMLGKSQYSRFYNNDPECRTYDTWHPTHLLTECAFCKEKSAFRYDPKFDHGEGHAIIVSFPSHQWRFCNVKKLICEISAHLRAAIILFARWLYSELTHFHSNIRRYISVFRITSFGATEQITVEWFQLYLVFKMYHQTGLLFSSS